MKFLLNLVLLFASCINFTCGVVHFTSTKHILNDYFGFDESTEESDKNNRDNFSLISNFSYFENLNANIGRNDTNSTCGYVAFGMLLTFYDSVLNKNIVSDDYGVLGNTSTSFGCSYDDFFNDTTHPFVADYYNFLRTIKSSSLHAKLILMHKGAEISNPSIIENTYEDEFGTNLEEIIGLATLYFTTYNLISNVSISYCSTYYGTSYSDFDYFVENELESNRPVMVGGSGHWYVVYGYSATQYQSHKGYIGNGNYDYKFLKSSFELRHSISDAISLHFDFSHHFHSLNYVNANNLNYCLCGYTHPSNHSYNFDYSYMNSNYHMAYCGCGEYITELHTYRQNIHNNPCPCGGSL